MLTPISKLSYLVGGDFPLCWGSGPPGESLSPASLICLWYDVWIPSVWRRFLLSTWTWTNGWSWRLRACKVVKKVHVIMIRSAHTCTWFVYRPMCDFNLWIGAWGDLEDQCGGLIWEMMRMRTSIYMREILEDFMVRLESAPTQVMLFIRESTWILILINELVDFGQKKVGKVTWFLKKILKITVAQLN